MNRKGFAALIIIGIVVILVVVGVVGYFAWKKSAEPQPQISAQSQMSQAATSTAAGSALPPADSFSNSSATKDDYGLFEAVPGSECGGLPGIQYYDGGTVASGTYGGYHRVIAGVQPCEPGGEYSVIFATKDYQTFIAQGTSSDYAAAKENFAMIASATSTPVVNAATGNYDVDFNYNKVVAFGDIPTDSPPATIALGNFMLVRNDYYYGDTPTSTPLSSPVPGLTFYADPSQYVTDSGGQQSDPTYLGNNNDVIVKTASGPNFDYVVVSPQEFANSSGTADSLNGIFYTSSEISSTARLYQTYGQIAPGACGGLATTYILQNISQSDLTEIGTAPNGIALYALKNLNNPLNHDEYNSKVDQYTDASGTLQIVSSPGTFSAYVAKNPVLTLQDPWGRWIGLGEFDNPTPGGCGKPVIYLYPPKPTAVTIKFTNDMRFTTDIPTYAGKWDVMAQPDGELTDLQPQLTDCAAIDSTVPGSEYAQRACDHNDYPYLYWEGQTAARYPTASGGWIVARNNISDFLNGKLTEIGLTDQEKSDMMSYWVPQLLKKNAPYYRISFFQTAQMDQFIPMLVSPQPDTVIRVFLDWTPLSEAPAVQPQPEILNHIARTGFTLVEWGGLKQ